jgi:hypothetical protein
MKIRVEPQMDKSWYAKFVDSEVLGGCLADTKSEAIAGLRKAYLDYKLGARLREDLKALVEEIEVDW